MTEDNKYNIYEGSMSRNQSLRQTHSKDLMTYNTSESKDSISIPNMNKFKE